ncbi:hypothetical protein GCM10009609_13880 [Pseudonocardia aurantiaca]
MTPPLPTPSEAETAVRALKVAKRANWIAVCLGAASLLISIGSVAEAKRANDTTQATRAQSVTLDAESAGLDGPIRFSLVNRNKEPIADVYYVYKMPNMEESKNVIVGTIPGCTRVIVVPPSGTSDEPGFKVERFGFRDSLGKTWRRGSDGTLTATTANDFTVAQPRTAGTTEKLEGC